MILGIDQPCGTFNYDSLCIGICPTATYGTERAFLFAVKALEDPGMPGGTRVPSSRLPFLEGKA